MRRDNKGFTLMELIIVVSIIGLVVTLGFTNYITSIKRSRDGKRKVDLEEVRSALEMCRTDTGSYPSGTLVSGNNITCGTATYMRIPNDPSTYRYYYIRTSLSTYRLCAHLEIGGGSTGCGNNCNGTCNHEVNNP